jgi:hypothetical protein
MSVRTVEGMFTRHVNGWEPSRETVSRDPASRASSAPVNCRRRAGPHDEEKRSPHRDGRLADPADSGSGLLFLARRRRREHQVMPTTALGQRLPQESDPNGKCPANKTPPTDGVAIADFGTVFHDSTYAPAIAGRTIGRRSRLEPKAMFMRTGHHRQPNGSVVRVDIEMGRWVGSLYTPEMKLKTQVVGSYREVHAWAATISV